MCASILIAANLSELITKSKKEYECLAVELANNPSKLSKIRSNLKTNIATTPLYNTRMFTKNLESAYKLIYDKYHDGLDSDHINV